MFNGSRMNNADANVLAAFGRYSDGTDGDELALVTSTKITFPMNRYCVSGEPHIPKHSV